MNSNMNHSFATNQFQPSAYHHAQQVQMSQQPQNNNSHPYQQQSHQPQYYGQTSFQQPIPPPMYQQPQANPPQNNSKISLATLQQNEDLLAAMVENFQLGRIQDCLQHFATLQENIVSMANELDNFPTEDSDAYKNLDVFPDRIMRDDALDKFLPFEKRNLPPSPLIAACAYCAAKVSDPELAAKKCRQECHHVLPGTHLSSINQLDSLKFSHVLLGRHRLQSQQSHRNNSTHNHDAASASSSGPKAATKVPSQSLRKSYKKWPEWEVYTMSVALCIFGNSLKKMCLLFPERNVCQVRHKMQKMLAQPLPPLESLLAHPPPGYSPPTLFTYLFNPSVDRKAAIARIVTLANASPSIVFDTHNTAPHIPFDPTSSSSSVGSTTNASNRASSSTLPITRQQNVADGIFGAISGDAPIRQFVARQGQNDFPLLLAAAKGILVDTNNTNNSTNSTHVGVKTSRPTPPISSTRTAEDTDTLPAADTNVVKGIDATKPTPNESNTDENPPATSKKAEVTHSEVTREEEENENEQKQQEAALPVLASPTMETNKATTSVESVNSEAEASFLNKESAANDPKPPSSSLDAQSKIPATTTTTTTTTKPIASNKQPPPFARQGFLRLKQQQQQQQQQIVSVLAPSTSGSSGSSSSRAHLMPPTNPFVLTALPPPLSMSTSLSNIPTNTSLQSMYPLQQVPASNYPITAATPSSSLQYHPHNLPNSNPNVNISLTNTNAMHNNIIFHNILDNSNNINNHNHHHNHSSNQSMVEASYLQSLFESSPTPLRYAAGSSNTALPSQQQMRKGDAALAAMATLGQSNPYPSGGGGMIRSTASLIPRNVGVFPSPAVAEVMARVDKKKLLQQHQQHHQQHQQHQRQQQQGVPTPPRDTASSSVSTTITPAPNKITSSETSHNNSSNPPTNNLTTSTTSETRDTTTTHAQDTSPASQDTPAEEDIYTKLQILRPVEKKKKDPKLRRKKRSSELPPFSHQRVPIHYRSSGGVAVPGSYPTDDHDSDNLDDSDSESDDHPQVTKTHISSTSTSTSTSTNNSNNNNRFLTPTGLALAALPIAAESSTTNPHQDTSTTRSTFQPPPSSYSSSSSNNNNNNNSNNNKPQSGLESDDEGLINMHDVQKKKPRVSKTTSKAHNSESKHKRTNNTSGSQAPPPPPPLSSLSSLSSSSSAQRAFAGIAMLQPSSVISSDILVDKNNNNNNNNRPKKRNASKRPTPSSSSTSSAPADMGGTHVVPVHETQGSATAEGMLMVTGGTGEESMLLTEGGEGLQGIVLTDELSFL